MGRGRNKQLSAVSRRRGGENVGQGAARLSLPSSSWTRHPMVLLWLLSLQGGVIRLFFQYGVTKCCHQGLLCALQVCATPLWLVSVRVLAAALAGAAPQEVSGKYSKKGG